MEQIFKGLESDTNQGDYIHLSPNGQQAIILDGVTHKNPIVARTNARNWLTEAYSHKARLQPNEVIQGLHELFKRSDCQAVIAVITALPNRFQIDVVGNINIIEFREHLPVLVHPTKENNFLGQPKQPSPECFEFERKSDNSFMVTTDGINARQILDKQLTIADFRHLTKAQLNSLAVERDWSAWLFPYVGARVSLDYTDIIFGTVEGEEHEVRGLRDIAEALIQRLEFMGSKLIIGSLISTQNHSREIDAILVSPFGIFVLELKDHAGITEIDIDGNGPGSMRLYSNSGTVNLDTNPKAKLKKLIQALGYIIKPLNILVEATRCGAVVFTSSQAHVKCINREGDSSSLPTTSGEFFFCRTAQLLDCILEHSSRWLGKTRKNLLTEEQIRTATELLYGRIQQSEPQFPDIPGCLVSWHKPLLSESNPYFTVYPGTHYGDDIWIKEYNFSNLSQTARDERIKSYKREAHSLHRLNRRRVSGVPYYYETLAHQQKFYVIVQAPPAKSLTKWLQENPSRAQRLAVIEKIAEILRSFSQLRAPSITHRGLHPNNIRIDDDENIWLINYELVQDDQTATIGIDERSQFVNSFLPYEVRQNMEVRPSADIYSFFMCSYFILTGERLAKDNGDLPRRLREFAKFNEHFASLGFTQNQIRLWFKGVIEEPKLRPSIAEIIDSVKTWI